jgi:hypothetical protein
MRGEGKEGMARLPETRGDAVEVNEFLTSVCLAAKTFSIKQKLSL